MDTGIDQASLTFQEQSDGRKVARLPTGKVVLVDFADVAKVKDGETWLVALEHRELYAIAHVIERQKRPAPLPARSVQPTVPNIVLAPVKPAP
ncbi:MAG: hypothetical protein LC623_04860 [Halobacteriales archaeon]|nr:hypothetical protein [Halobacteriales archaeon]